MSTLNRYQPSSTKLAWISSSRACEMHNKQLQGSWVSAFFSIAPFIPFIMGATCRWHSNSGRLALCQCSMNCDFICIWKPISKNPISKKVASYRETFKIHWTGFFFSFNVLALTRQFSWLCRRRLYPVSCTTTKNLGPAPQLRIWKMQKSEDFSSLYQQPFLSSNLLNYNLCIQCHKG